MKALHKSRQFDRRAALGVLLYVLVTGKPPDTLDSLNTVSDEMKTIQVVCRQCLAENPSDRFSSANELIEKLIGLQSV